jgi:hypothetical protein
MVMDSKKCACGCGAEITKKGKRFFNRTHKDAFYNRSKTRGSHRAFIEELKALLKKYGLDR